MLRSLRCTTTAAAFSLIEIVIAIAIVAFALVAIIGMFPVALKSAKESQQETQAALIGRQIIEGIKSNRPFIVENASVKDGTTRIDIRSASQTRFEFDESGRITSASPSTDEPPSSLQPVYIATVDVKPGTPEPGLTRVDVIIYTPPEAATGNRNTFEFVTLVSTAQIDER